MGLCRTLWVQEAGKADYHERPIPGIDVPSCNSGVSPTKTPDITACHGASMMLDPTWFHLVVTTFAGWVNRHQT